MQKITSIMMCVALAFATTAVLLPRMSRAQTSLRDELERTGIVAPIVNQNSANIAAQGERISALSRRISVIENIGADRRLALLEDYVLTAKENQKLLWGMLVTLAFFVMKEIYIAFFKPRPTQHNLIS